MKNRVIELLGCRHPILQGAMGVISNPELVAAVSEAGGFGQLATAFCRDPDAVRAQVRAVKKLTDKPFGANLMLMNPQNRAFADVLAEEGIRAATVSGGSPRELVPALHERGIAAIVVVPTAELARKAEAMGADAVVAEGGESGGIQGLRGVSTLVLTPAVADAVKIPVIAAGGICDARGFRAALALGAEGVQVGTRFIATRECAAHRLYKEEILKAEDTGTELLFMGRYMVRALSTELAIKVGRGQVSASDIFTGQALEASWLGGDLDAGILPAGQGAALVRDLPAAGDVVRNMAGDRE